MSTQPTTDKASPQSRRWRRCHFAVPVRVTVGQNTLAEARCWRMNNGGTAVHTDTELSVGSEAEIQFTPPHFYPPVTVHGVIRNRAGDLYGVEFLARSTKEKKQLSLFQKILARWSS